MPHPESGADEKGQVVPQVERVQSDEKKVRRRESQARLWERRTGGQRHEAEEHRIKGNRCCGRCMM